MGVKISKLQVVEQKNWSGLTTENHLGWLAMKEPEYISKVIDRVYELNYGADNFVSFIEKFPVMYLNQDGIYRWTLQGSEERNIPLVKATVTLAGSQITDADRAGLAGGTFYLWFGERYFSATSQIVGSHPETYSVRAVEDPVQYGNYWAYKCVLWGGDQTLFLPADEVAAGTRWSEDFAYTEQTLSMRGNDVHHTSPFIMENTTSQIRKQYFVPGNMITEGKNHPLAFDFIDQNGKRQTRWIDKLGWDFAVQFRRDKARLLMYGKSNRLADGSFQGKGESGYTIRAGYGLYEQMGGGNVAYYNNFSIDFLTDFAQNITYNKVPEDKRVFVLNTGSWGAYQLHKALMNKAASYPWLRDGYNLKVGADGKIDLQEGQMVSFKWINGITFQLMIDPMKDDPVRNKVMHPDGGPASSYVYDIFDFGTSNGQPNIQRVAVKDNEEFFGYIPGMRDPFSPFNKRTEPRMMATSKDGYEVHKQFIGGVLLRNPLKTGRLIPTIYS